LAYLERRIEPEPFRIHVVNADGSNDREYGPAPGWLVGWTPDHSLIFGNVLDDCTDPGLGCDSRGELFDPTTGGRKKIRNVMELGPWSPDATQVLGQLQMNVPDRPPDTGWPFVVQVIDWRTDDRQLVTFGSSHVFPVGWMADGKSFIVSVSEATAPFTAAKCSAWRISSFNVSDRSLIAEDTCAPVRLSADGTRLWYGRYPDPTEEIPGLDSELWVLDMSTGSKRLLISGAHQYFVWEPASASISDATPDPLPPASDQAQASGVPTESASTANTPTPVSTSASPALPDVPVSLAPTPATSD
jgi:hypothetical protein